MHGRCPRSDTTPNGSGNRESALCCPIFAELGARWRSCWNRRRGSGSGRPRGGSTIGQSLKYPIFWSGLRRIKLRLPDCKPVSVPLRAVVIPLGRPLLAGSSNLPGSQAERAAPPPLFGLAPRGVCLAGGIAPAAVRSYRTISPLPGFEAGRYIFCGTFRRARWPARPLAGTPPFGDRTFLSRQTRSDYPSSSLLTIVALRREP